MDNALGVTLTAFVLAAKIMGQFGSWLDGIKFDSIK
jgi:hypothetical protein